MIEIIKDDIKAKKDLSIIGSVGDSVVYTLLCHVNGKFYRLMKPLKKDLERITYKEFMNILTDSIDNIIFYKTEDIFYNNVSMEKIKQADNNHRINILKSLGI
jgi:hypothetical protein